MHLYDLIVLGLYFLVIVVVTASNGSASNRLSYFLADYSFSWIELSLSSIATQFSAISIFSVTAFIGFQKGGGLAFLSYEIGYVLVSIVLITYILPVFYRMKAVSVNAYLGRRFGFSTRVLVSFTFQLLRVNIVGLQFYVLSQVISNVYGYPFYLVVLLVSAFILLYTLIGGMKAVVWTNLVQLMFMILAIANIVFISLFNFNDFGHFLQAVDHTRTATFFQLEPEQGLTNSVSFIKPLITSIIMYLAMMAFDQTQMQKFNSASSLRNARKSVFAAGLIRFPFAFALGIGGLLVGTAVAQNDTLIAQINELESFEGAIIVYINHYVPVGIKGLVIAGILAFAMSTCSSMLNAMGAVSTEDYISRYTTNTKDANITKILSSEKHVQAQEKFLMKISYLGIIFWTVAAVTVTFFTERVEQDLFEYLQIMTLMIVAPICSVFLLGLFFKSANTIGVNVAFVLCICASLYLWFFEQEHVPWFTWLNSSAVATIIVGLLGSLLVAELRRSKEVRKNISHLVAKLSLKPLRATDIIILSCYTFFIVIFLYFLQNKL